MIKNERQLTAAKRQIAKLGEALSLSKERTCKMDPRIYEAMVAGIQSQIDDIKKEVQDYELIVSSQQIPSGTLSDIGKQLIKARIARGYTQNELAEKVGVKPQQIQKYESNEYSSIGMKTLVKIIDALGAVVDTFIELEGTMASIFQEPSDRDYIVNSVESEVTVSELSKKNEWFGMSESAIAQWDIHLPEAA